MAKLLIRNSLAALLCLVTASAWAGGPLVVGGPGDGTPGKALTWAAGVPIHYHVDSGPLAVNPSGVTVIDNKAGIPRVDAMFKVWQDVPTANISYVDDGPIPATGTFTGGDVKTAADFNAVDGACAKGTFSAIVFDADGSITNQLFGDPLVIGFAGPCAVDRVTGNIVAGDGVLNGKFQDGVNSPGTQNFELTTDEFNQAFTHEFGHLSGLGHSQINVDVLNQTGGNCNADEVAGLPLMFPILQCQARVTAGLPPLSPDDTAWISFLYPVQAPAPAGKTAFSSVYGTIHGRVLLSDGATGIQEVNVIARQVDDPATPQNESLTTAFSSVSGYLFTDSVGQNVTCTVPNPSDPNCNVGGDPFGSRDTSLVGTFDIPALAGTYTLDLESVDPSFTGGSSVGPLANPIPMPGTAPAPATVTVTPGSAVNTGTDIKLQNTPPIFDSFETSQLFMPQVFGETFAEGGRA